ncbi:MAG: Uma2 family endonuclease [Bryobacteraceae bacterium]
MATLGITVKRLVDGECLSREEFLGRWDLLPELKTAELVRGKVHMASPLSRDHGRFESMVTGWLVAYSARTPGCEVLSNATWLMLNDVPQPDVVLRITREYGGQSGMRGNLAAGAPELIVEIALTGADYDLGQKKDLYEEAGVPEYFVVVAGSRVVWHASDSGRFVEIAPEADGIHRSRVFPGLWLDPAALLAGDLPLLLATLEKGLASPAHADFTKSLATARRCYRPSYRR